MVFKADVEAGLRQLAAIKRQMLTLIEWDRLAQREQRPHVPPGFAPQTSAREHIRDELSDTFLHFWSVAADIRYALERPDLDCTQQKRSSWEQRLEQLETQLGGLGIGARFIKP